MTSALERPFVTARTAAAALGVSIERVVEDIDAGMDGNLTALIGAAKDGVYYLPRWEIEGERLEMHRARLADGDAVRVVSPGTAADRETPVV